MGFYSHVQLPLSREAKLRELGRDPVEFVSWAALTRQQLVDHYAKRIERDGLDPLHVQAFIATDMLMLGMMIERGEIEPTVMPRHTPHDRS